MAPPAGEWADDQKHGFGTMVYPSGNVYTGEWARDEKSGAGCMAWHAAGQSYAGQWERGLPNGLGEHTWEQEAPGPGSHATCLMPNR